MQTYTHRIKRTYRLSIFLDPPSPKKTFNCHCWCNPYRLVCPSCISKMGLTSRCAVPVRWVLISSRSDDKCLVDIIGGTDPRQDIDLLNTWGVPSAAIHFEGLKAIEQNAVIERKAALRLAEMSRRFLVAPCTNQVVEGDRNENPDCDPEEGADWSHESKKMLFQGELVQTTLPRFDCGLRYFISVYWIEETPNYPAKVEIIANAPNGVWFPEELQMPVQKAMSQFVLGICQAAGVTSIPKRLKMQGESYTVAGRGLQMAPDATRRAAALADGVDMDWEGYTLLRRETLVAAMCFCAGKPLSPNTIAELLNGVEGKKALQRTPRPYRYAWVPPTVEMGRLQRQCSKKLRIAAGDETELSNDEQEVDAVSELEDTPEADVALLTTEITSGAAPRIVVEEDEFHGLGDDLLTKETAQCVA